MTEIFVILGIVPNAKFNISTIFSQNKCPAFLHTLRTYKPN